MHTLAKYYGHSKFEIDEMIERIYRLIPQTVEDKNKLENRYKLYQSHLEQQGKEYEPFYIWGLQDLDKYIYEHIYNTEEERERMIEKYKTFCEKVSEDFLDSFRLQYKIYREEKIAKGEFVKQLYVYVIYLCDLFGMNLE